MKRKKDKPILEDREKYDRRLLIFFSFWVLLGLFFNIMGIFIIREQSLGSLIPGLLESLSFAFFITGLLAIKYHRKRGIIPGKRILKWFAKISLVIGLVVAVGMTLLATQTTIFEDQFIGLSGVEVIGLFIVMYIFGFFFGFVFPLFFMIAGFGMIGVLSALIRLKTADLLVEITKITPNTSDSVKEKDKKTYMGYIWLGWAFNIPDVLDTRALDINRGEPKKKIPWPILKQAVIWQIFFGLVIVIYISFSPFFLDITEMGFMFSIASNVTNFIPIFILPWFIYLRLDAKIKGIVKDFKLFDGLKSRMLQTIVAFSTLILFVRMALVRPGFKDIIGDFLGYFMLFIITVIVTTFVYFNYFENDLAYDIARKYEEIKIR
ncbi:MAG: hypothetical protein JSW00_18865 [Thermoplasmata archaeon]|nr:MAG: hypothetical protein JSW00_18865 [Thermoplasmata archaeon]